MEHSESELADLRAKLEEAETRLGDTKALLGAVERVRNELQEALEEVELAVEEGRPEDVYKIVNDALGTALGPTEEEGK